MLGKAKWGTPGVSLILFSIRDEAKGMKQQRGLQMEQGRFRNSTSMPPATA